MIIFLYIKNLLKLFIHKVSLEKILKFLQILQEFHQKYSNQIFWVYGFFYSNFFTIVMKVSLNKQKFCFKKRKNKNTFFHQNFYYNSKFSSKFYSKYLLKFKLISFLHGNHLRNEEKFNIRKYLKKLSHFCQNFSKTFMKNWNFIKNQISSNCKIFSKLLWKFLYKNILQTNQDIAQKNLQIID